MQKFINKPSIDMLAGITVTKDTATIVVEDKTKSKDTPPCVACLLFYHQHSIYCNKCGYYLNNSPKRSAKWMKKDTNYRTSDSTVI